VTTIGPTHPLLAELRARALALRRREPARARSGATGERRAAQEAPQDWSAALARAVVAIDPDDPQRRRKAFRAFLQSVLAREVGIQVPEDPAFQSLVDQVQQAMELNPRLREAMARAGEMLLESAGG